MVFEREVVDIPLPSSVHTAGPDGRGGKGTTKLDSPLARIFGTALPPLRDVRQSNDNGNLRQDVDDTSVEKRLERIEAALQELLRGSRKETDDTT